MTLTQLQHEYPGLFEPPRCQSLSDAERCVEVAASNAGLSLRAASWTGSDGNARLEYRNRIGTVSLQVGIYPDNGGRSSTPSWLFSFSAERVDANLTAESPHAIRVKPSAFQKEVLELVSGLRALQVKKGRVVGRVTKWNSERGIGLVECFPGAVVSLEASELPGGSKVGHRELLSFVVQKTSSRQRAIKVRRCDGR
jgi:hypothetical protein